MKLSDGFSKWLPAGLMVLFYGLCFFCLTLALKRVEVSTAYAIWSGLGTALITMLGIVVFKEALTPLKLVGVGAIIVGVVALNFAATHA